MTIHLTSQNVQCVSMYFKNDVKSTMKLIPNEAKFHFNGPFWQYSWEIILLMTSPNFRWEIPHFKSFSISSRSLAVLSSSYFRIRISGVGKRSTMAKARSAETPANTINCLAKSSRAERSCGSGNETKSDAGSQYRCVEHNASFPPYHH